MKRHARSEVNIDYKTRIKMNIYYQEPIAIFGAYYFVSFEGERVEVAKYNGDWWFANFVDMKTVRGEVNERN